MSCPYEYQPPEKPDCCGMCGSHTRELKLCVDAFWLCRACEKQNHINLVKYANRRNAEAFRTVMNDAELGMKIRTALSAICKAIKIS